MISLKNIVVYRANYPDGHLRAQYDRLGCGKKIEDDLHVKLSSYTKLGASLLKLLSVYELARRSLFLVKPLVEDLVKALSSTVDLLQLPLILTVTGSNYCCHRLRFSLSSSPPLILVVAAADSRRCHHRLVIDSKVSKFVSGSSARDVAKQLKLLAKEGETVEPGVKIAVISKSGEGAPQVAPLEQPASQPSPPKKQESVEKQTPKAETAPVKEAKKEPSPPPKAKGLPSPPKPTEPQLPPKDRERRVPMTRLRKRVATRLKDSQNTFAMLTTFNEVDIRKQETRLIGEKGIPALKIKHWVHQYIGEIEPTRTWPSQYLAPLVILYVVGCQVLRASSFIHHEALPFIDGA
ncbi:hypothetical protein L484_023706 [Morus notabilis]|uniref:Uncharacterized protein n=1 Tax=Morus notabilis TaxID=981085 RepID=W9R124_9ROSA|nr:hypothetical protein L484_023706 [Morus notabilis]